MPSVINTLPSPFPPSLFDNDGLNFLIKVLLNVLVFLQLEFCNCILLLRNKQILDHFIIIPYQLFVLSLKIFQVSLNVECDCLFLFLPNNFFIQYLRFRLSRLITITIIYINLSCSFEDFLSINLFDLESRLKTFNSKL